MGRRSRTPLPTSSPGRPLKARPASADDLLVQARSALLDALTALSDHHDSVVVIGAQANLLGLLDLEDFKIIDLRQAEDGVGVGAANVMSYRYWYDHSMDAATLIRATRESAGLSQGALAARAGTSQPAVSRYESGASSPSVETLDRLLAVMGARLDLVAKASPRRLDVRTPRMVKLRENRERIRRAAHRHGAKNVRIFGSVARGEDRPDSDIDLLVDFDVRSRGLFPLAGLQDELAVLLGERVEVVPEDALAPRVAQNALAEAVPL